MWCPYCGIENQMRFTREGYYHCMNCNKKFKLTQAKVD